MDNLFAIIFWGALSGVVLYSIVKTHRDTRHKRQQAFIKSYQFPETIKQKVAEKYPHLRPKQLETVIDGLRSYFLICQASRLKVTSMPSQVVDTAWHEMILFTQAYQDFCKQAFGRFLHHIPAEAMKKPTMAQKGIRRSWAIACAQEKILPHKPKRLLLLFAIDHQLSIDDGFHYTKDCLANPKKGQYCASHIGCASGRGIFSGGCGGSGDSSGDGSSGCGGGGCGGGS